MTTLTATYCTFCEWCNSVARKIVRTFEIAGYARAAHELHRLGYHAEAQQLMRDKLNLEKAPV